MVLLSDYNTNPANVYSGAASLALTTGTVAGQGANVTSFNNPMLQGHTYYRFTLRRPWDFQPWQHHLAPGTWYLELHHRTTSFTNFNCTVTPPVPLIPCRLPVALLHRFFSFYLDAVNIVSSTNLVSKPGFESGHYRLEQRLGSGAAVAWNLNRQYVYGGIG